MTDATDSRLVCELLVDAGDDTVVALLRERFGVDDSFSSFDLGDVEVDVRRNELPTGHVDPDDFAHWRALAEIHALRAMSHDRVVAFVADLMAGLRFAGHRVVAVHGLEDELPQPDLP